MSRTATGSDAHLQEVLQAAKAKLAKLNQDIILAKEDNATYQGLVNASERERAATAEKAQKLKNELSTMETQSRELNDESKETRTTINAGKQELASLVECGEHDYKELIMQIKKLQDEQIKLQAQYKDEQKESQRLDKEQERVLRARENLDRKKTEIHNLQTQLQAHQLKDTDRFQRLEDQAKEVYELSSPPS